MSDRAGLISEPIFCKACGEHFVAVAERYWDEVVIFHNKALFVAGSMRLMSSIDLHYQAANMTDALRRRVCHPVRFTMICEPDPFDNDEGRIEKATPYTAEEMAAEEAAVEAKRAEYRAVEAHRASVLAEADANEPVGHIPLDDFLKP